MIAPTQGQTGHTATIAADQSYWGVIDASALPRPLLELSRTRDERLGYLFESVLPVPIDDVQAVFVPIDGRRFIACAIDRDRLLSRLATLAESQTILQPSEMPDAVEHECDSGGFNLLVGEFLPPAVRRLRQWLARLIVGGAILISAVLFLGMEIRIRDAKSRIREIDAARQRIYEHTLGYTTGPAPPELQLLAELRQLRQTRGEQTETLETRSVSEVLGAVLQRWPDDLNLQTDLLNVTEDTVTIRGTAPTAEDVQRLAAALSGAEGMRVEQPEFSPAAEGVQATIRLIRGSE